MTKVGFHGAELVAETGFNSAAVTRGALFRASKPQIFRSGEEERTMEDSLSKYQTFFESAYAQGVLDRKTKHLIALGASLGAGCED